MSILLPAITIFSGGVLTGMLFRASWSASWHQVCKFKQHQIDQLHRENHTLLTQRDTAQRDLDAIRLRISMAVSKGNHTRARARQLALQEPAQSNIAVQSAGSEGTTLAA